MLVLNRAIKPALLAAGQVAGDYRMRRSDSHRDRELMHPNHVKRLLLWSMNSLGDVLRATPAIASLRCRFPNAHIAMVAAGRAAPILRHNSNLDELIEIPKAYDPLQHRTAMQKLRGRGQRWDLGILLEVSPLWTLVESLYLRCLGVNRWVCFDFGRGAPKRAIRIPLNRSGSWIDQFNSLAAATGADATNRRMEIHLTDVERHRTRKLLALEGLEIDAPFFVIHAGGNALEVSRRWSPESFAAVATKLWNKWRYPIILTGTSPEQPIINAIRHLTSAPSIDLCGKLGMRELAALIERATLCVMNDTGPLHIAHALRRPTVAILGPTDPQVVGIPDTTETVRASLPCSPCARFAGWRACTNNNQYECLQAVTPRMVMDAAERLMSPSVRLMVLQPVLEQLLTSVSSAGGIF